VRWHTNDYVQTFAPKPRIEHIRSSWTMTRFIPQHFVTVVPPQMNNGPEWFQGTADSVYQNIHLIESFSPIS